MEVTACLIIDIDGIMSNKSHRHNRGTDGIRISQSETNNGLLCKIVFIVAMLTNILF